MNFFVRRILPAFLLCVSVLLSVAPARGQESLSLSTRPAITVLDSTKEQDGLFGSVRRVKTETARIEFKDGRPVEGPAQLVEITTYGIKGNRVENTSYPIGGSLVGKEEYKYDERGNITEMTLRDERGAIVSREAYSYELDKFGNWTKMITSLVVFENGELKREPIEVTYRTLTYYFDDNIAKIVEEPKTTQIPESKSAPDVPTPLDREILETGISEPRMISSSEGSTLVAEEPPPVFKPSRPEGIESAFAARKEESAEATAENKAAENAQQMHAYSLYATGRDRFDAGDAQGAVESFLQSIKLEPGSAEVYLSLGHAYLKLSEDREAINAFKDSIKLNPKAPETFYGLGFAQFRLGRFRDAADAFKKATTLDPKMGKAHYGLSLAYQELGMTNELMDEYRILEKLDRELARKLRQTFPQFHFPCRLLMGC